MCQIEMVLFLSHYHLSATVPSFGLCNVISVELNSEYYKKIYKYKFKNII